MVIARWHTLVKKATKKPKPATGWSASSIRLFLYKNTTGCAGNFEIVTIKNPYMRILKENDKGVAIWKNRFGRILWNCRNFLH